MSIRSYWSVVLLSSSIFLLIFSLVVLTIVNSWSFQRYLWVCIFILSVLSVFALHILHLCCLMYIHLRLLHVLGWLTLCHHVMFFLIPGIFCALKPILYANKAIPVSFSLMFVCYIFFHLFYFQPIYTITETKSTVFTSIFALSMSFLSLWCSRNPSFIIFSLFR